MLFTRAQASTSDVVRGLLGLAPKTAILLKLDKQGA